VVFCSERAGRRAWPLFFARTRRNSPHTPLPPCSCGDGRKFWRRREKTWHKFTTKLEPFSKKTFEESFRFSLCSAFRPQTLKKFASKTEKFSLHFFKFCAPRFFSKRKRKFSVLEFRKFGTAESGTIHSFIFLYFWPSLPQNPPLRGRQQGTPRNLQKSLGYAIFWIRLKIIFNKTT
jgi:hypothetical protein